MKPTSVLLHLLKVSDDLPAVAQQTGRAQPQASQAPETTTGEKMVGGGTGKLKPTEPQLQLQQPLV